MRPDILLIFSLILLFIIHKQKIEASRGAEVQRFAVTQNRLVVGSIPSLGSEIFIYIYI